VRDDLKRPFSWKFATLAQAVQVALCWAEERSMEPCSCQQQGTLLYQNLQAWQLWLSILTGWINHREQDVIEYLPRFRVAGKARQQTRYAQRI